MTPKPKLEEVFRSATPGRDSFLSRLFGIFSEEVVHHWCRQPHALYEDLGRPSLYSDGAYRHTLDFMLRSRETGDVYISELKCELQFENYRYLRLRDESQLRLGKRGASFDAFMALARDPSAYEIRVNAKRMTPAGVILVWGAMHPDGKAMAAGHQIADVLSIEDMLDDLSLWKPIEWSDRVRELRGWSNALFDHLAPGA